MEETRRLVDGRTCALVTCCKGIAPGEDAVMIAVDERALKSIAGASCRVAWGKGGRIAMHSCCYDVVRAAPAEGVPRNQAENKLVRLAADSLERFDALPAVERAAAETAALVLAHRGGCVAFTGAGISVNAGIPDYRGTAGVDTKAKMHQETDSEEDEVDYTALRPTRTHVALAQLEHRSLLAYTVTQNCDNLHARAGTSRARLSELHGNVFVEYCETCLAEYERSFAVDEYSTDCRLEKWFIKCKHCGWGHYTGRRCTKKGCRGRLRDTIVNFGDDLHESVLGGLPRAEEECTRAEVCLALGSSLSVTPANELPTRTTAALIVVNLQQTDLDDKANVRVHAESDVFMTLLMRHIDEAQTSAPAVADEIHPGSADGGGAPASQEEDTQRDGVRGSASEDSPAHDSAHTRRRKRRGTIDRGGRSGTQASSGRRASLSSGIAGGGRPAGSGTKRSKQTDGGGGGRGARSVASKHVAGN
mmetsp:Transcript_22025/g.59402  ORF Transcript_22025/g.59402 Transcript_22025/m.59402 type:complete len:476 (-) Transcript_22025:417-1844(-)